MSINVVFVLEFVAEYATVAVAILAIYRSLSIGKLLVTRVYRTRANWLAALMIIFAAFAAVPTSSALELQISNILFFVFLLALLIFIDSNVAVAKEIDFFHKDILHWQTIRKPMVAIVVVYSAIAFFATVVFPNLAPSIAGIGFVGYFVVVGVAFAYSGTAMLAIGRRTYDVTMKKFVKMLGFAILCFVLFLTLFIPLDAVYPSLGDIVTNFIAIAGAYFFYKAAMSLSFVGRIVKEVA